MGQYETCTIRLILDVARREKIVILLLLGISIMLSIVHTFTVDFPRSVDRLQLHRQIIEGTAQSPYRYRVLLPVIAHVGAIAAQSSGRITYRKAVTAIYIGIQFAAIFGGLTLFYGYSQIWLPRIGALVGTLFVAAMMAPTFLYYFFQPWGHLEFLTFTAAMWLIEKQRPGWFALLVVIATLNRETGCFLVVLYGLCNWQRLPQRRVFAVTTALACITATTILGLRFVRGFALHEGQERPDFLVYRFVANMTHPLPIISVICFFGVLWVLAFRNLQEKPALLTRALWYLPVFFTAHLLAANIEEVRYFLTICPIIVPLAMLSLLPEVGLSANRAVAIERS